MEEREALFGEIRGLLDDPSSENFNVIMSKLIESTLEPEVLAEEFVPYAEEKLTAWPTHAWRRVPDDHERRP